MSWARAMSWMVGPRWPGNVRELENMIERAVTLARGPRITRTDLGIEFVPATPAGGLRPTLAEVEEQYIRRVLEEASLQPGVGAWRPPFSAAVRAPRPSCGRRW
ncbi:MAG: hypothetical protein ACREK6_08125 [Candidatus Rokuibacteriota bacterium]